MLQRYLAYKQNKRISLASKFLDTLPIYVVTDTQLLLISKETLKSLLIKNKKQYNIIIHGIEYTIVYNPVNNFFSVNLVTTRMLIKEQIVSNKFLDAIRTYILNT